MLQNSPFFAQEKCDHSVTQAQGMRGAPPPIPYTRSSCSTKVEG
jgi:hypothetical protein